MPLAFQVGHHELRLGMGRDRQMAQGDAGSSRPHPPLTNAAKSVGFARKYRDVATLKRAAYAAKALAVGGVLSGPQKQCLRRMGAWGGGDWQHRTRWGGIGGMGAGSVPVKRRSKTNVPG
jgi:hypothetical protein